MSATASPAVTLHEAAEMLGVHYMTAYRYVRLGLLAASKSGGVWQVEVADLAEFKAGGPSSPQPARGSQRRAPWADRLEARLIAGDAHGAWGVIEAAMTAGVGLERVYGEVLSPALAQIGARWERNELDISVEHRASGIAMRIIGRLGPRFIGRGRTRGAVVLGSPAGERHSLPLAMLADLIRLQRWDVSDLGADVPTHSFVHAAIATPDLAAVGVSVTVSESLEAAAITCAALRVALPDLMVVVGGAAIRDGQHALDLGATAYAADNEGFTALLEAWRAGN
jgi:MerR family transcriptional regulator, light-induced transcriptional regulator